MNRLNISAQRSVLLSKKIGPDDELVMMRGRDRRVKDETFRSNEMGRKVRSMHSQANRSDPKFEIVASRYGRRQSATALAPV